MPGTDRTSLLVSAIENVFGPTAVVGSDTGDLVAAVASGATELLCWVDEKEMAPLSDRCHRDGLVSPFLGGVSGNMPVAPGVLSSLVLLDWPQVDQPVAFLECLMGCLADGSPLLVDLPVRSARDRRFRLLIDAMARDVIVVDADPQRLCLAGFRNAPGREHGAAEPLDPVDVAVVVLCRGASGELSDLCGDLLVRQHVSPTQVLIINDDADSENAVPGDLWGMAVASDVQVEVVTTGGVGVDAAFEKGLEHVDSAGLLLLEEGDRVSSGLLRTLHTQLARQTGGCVAVGGDVTRSAESVADTFLPQLDAENLAGGYATRRLAALFNLEALGEFGLEEDFADLSEASAWQALLDAGGVAISRAPLKVTGSCDPRE